MTINITELRRLAQAATPGPDGVSLSWIKLLQDFQQSASPAAISELLDRLEAAEKERDSYKFAFIEYSEKTEWVQRGVNDGTVPAKYLGWHRADVMSDLLSAAEKERDALRARIEAVERQEPVSWADAFGEPFRQKSEIDGVASPLYALPGAKGE